MNISIFAGTDVKDTRIIDDTLEVKSIHELAETITKTLWAPSTFTDNIRTIKTFQQTDLLVLDVDDGLTIKEAQAIFARYRHIIATSKSHQIQKGNKPACDRFRVILFLDSQITTDSDYKATWFEAQKLCPQIDAACKDSSRFFYPCVQIVAVNDFGLPFPTKRFIATTTSEVKEADTELKRKGQLSKRATKFLNSGAAEGNWHAERNNFVRECRQNGYTYEEMRTLFCIYHKPDATDEFQFNDVWERGVKHGPRLTDDENAELVTLIRNSKLIIDVANPDNTILIDPNTGLTHDVHRRTIAMELGKEEFGYYLKASSIKAKLEYRPDYHKMLFRDTTGLNVFNTYQPPEWLREMFFFERPLEPIADLPPIYNKFFTHLTAAHTDSLNYLVDWLATSIQGRNLTLLTAIGEQGIGKGTLGLILERLHGSTNFSKVRDSVFKERFNAPLKNKTLVLVDEIELKTKEAQDRIKDMANDVIEIEEKGVDARGVRNWASFYLCSNTMDAVKIEGGDRRFSIIQLTDTKIIHSDCKDIIPQLLEPQNIDSLGRYLKFKPITRNMYEPFKSQRYEEVREAGLTDWELYVIEDWAPKHRGREILLSELKLDIERTGMLQRAPGRPRLEQLARKFPEIITIKRRGPSGDKSGLWYIRINQNN